MGVGEGRPLTLVRAWSVCVAAQLVLAACSGADAESADGDSARNDAGVETPFGDAAVRSTDASAIDLNIDDASLGAAQGAEVSESSVRLLGELSWQGGDYPAELMNGLSNQLVVQVTCEYPGWLSAFEEGMEPGQLSMTRRSHRLMQTSMLDALTRVAREADDYITLRSAYRDVAQQYFDWRWGYELGFLALPPGESAHQGGFAVDLEFSEYWRERLLEAGFTWPYGEEDAPHYEYWVNDADASLTREAAIARSVQAFAALWNHNNPDDPFSVAADEPETLERLRELLARSPVAGFESVPCQVFGGAADAPSEAELRDEAPEPERLASATVENLADDFDRLLESQPGVHAVFIEDLETGQVLVSREAESALVPGSNVKLFTTAAALLALGGDYAFASRAYAHAPISDGVIDGSLWLSSEYDPSWTEEFFESDDAVIERLLSLVVASGVEAVEGDLLLSGPFLVGGYRVGTYVEEQQDERAIELAERWLDAHPEFDVRGRVIVPTAEEEAQDDASERSLDVELRSIDLTTLSAHINRSSHNEFADLLWRHLAKQECESGDVLNDSPAETHAADAGAFIEGSASLALRSLRQLGIALPQLVDGSGLSTENRVTTAQVVDLLRLMLRTRHGEAWLRGFSVPGVVGTLFDRMNRTPLNGRVFAKTGSLSGVVSLSGVFDHPDTGRRYAFSFISNEVDDEDAVRELHDQLLFELYEATLPSRVRPAAPTLLGLRLELPERRLLLETTADASELLVWFSRDGLVWDRRRAKRSAPDADPSGSVDLGRLTTSEPMLVRLSHATSEVESAFSPTFVVQTGSAAAFDDAAAASRRRLLLVDGNRRIRAAEEDNPIGGGGHPFAARYAGALPGWTLETIDAARFELQELGERSPVELGEYAGILWACGESGPEQPCLSDASRRALSVYLADGGRLFISGSELSWTLNRGSEDERRFLEDVLYTRFVADDAESHRVLLGASPLDEVSFYDPTWMKVSYADRIAPLGEAQGFIDYSHRGQSDGIDHAGIAYLGPDHGVVVLGFPFEAVVRAEHRATLMNRVLTRLGLAVVAESGVR